MNKADLNCHVQFKLSNLKGSAPLTDLLSHLKRCHTWFFFYHESNLIHDFCPSYQRIETPLFLSLFLMAFSRGAQCFSPCQQTMIRPPTKPCSIVAFWCIKKRERGDEMGLFKQKNVMAHESCPRKRPWTVQIYICVNLNRSFTFHSV